MTQNEHAGRLLQIIHFVDQELSLSRLTASLIDDSDVYNSIKRVYFGSRSGYHIRQKLSRDVIPVELTGIATEAFEALSPDAEYDVDAVQMAHLYQWEDIKAFTDKGAFRDKVIHIRMSPVDLDRVEQVKDLLGYKSASAFIRDVALDKIKMCPAKKTTCAPKAKDMAIKVNSWELSVIKGRARTRKQTVSSYVRSLILGDFFSLCTV